MQSLKQTEINELDSFLTQYGLTELREQILEIQKLGFDLEFLSASWRLSRATRTQIRIGVLDLKEPSLLKLIVAHEIAHILRKDAEAKETRLDSEIRAWKKAFGSIELTKEAFEFAQNCISTYYKTLNLVITCSEAYPTYYGITTQN